MGRRGPQAKPTEQHRAEGTLRKDRHATTPVIVGGRGIPEPAAYMTARQKEHFRALVEELRESGLLDKADRGMLELAAVKIDELARCNRHLARSLTVKVPRGGYKGSEERTVTEVSPFVRIRKEAVAELRYLYRELGIGPASRAAMANAGIKGRPATKELPGVGAKPTPLRVVNGESE